MEQPPIATPDPPSNSPNSATSISTESTDKDETEIDVQDGSDSDQEPGNQIIPAEEGSNPPATQEDDEEQPDTTLSMHFKLSTGESVFWERKQSDTMSGFFDRSSLETEDSEDWVINSIDHFVDFFKRTFLSRINKIKS